MKTAEQQELNVRFAKARGWVEKPRENGLKSHWLSPDGILCGEHPNYFAPENFHLVRAAVGALFEIEKNLFYNHIKDALDPENQIVDYRAFVMLVFLSPVEHIITAYLKVKGVN